MASLNICLLVVFMAFSVCCDVVEEFSAAENDEGFSPTDQDGQDMGFSAAGMFEQLSAAGKDEELSTADQEDELSGEEKDEGISAAEKVKKFTAAEKDVKLTAAEHDDGLSVADEDDRGQCSANKEGQCSSGEEENDGKAKVKSLYEMFEKGGEDKHTPDEWIQSLANDKAFAQRLDEDVEFREKIEKELAELTAQNLADDLQEGEEG